MGNPIPAPQAYTFAAPAAVPGDIARTDETNVESAQLVGVGGTVFPSQFGLAMQYVTGGIQQFNTGAETAAAFAGILVRNAPGISGSVADDSAPNFSGSPWQNNVPVDMAVRGYMGVQCFYGTPVRGGIVYVRIIANGNNSIVGTFDATADGGNNVALSNTQASWASDGKDANSFAEVRIAR